MTVACKGIRLSQNASLGSLCTVTGLLAGALALLAWFGQPVLSVFLGVSGFLLCYAAYFIAKKNRPVKNGTVAFVANGLEVRMPDRAPMLIGEADVLRGFELPNGLGLELELTRRRDLALQLAAGAEISHRAVLSHLRATVDERPFVAPLRRMTFGWILLVVGGFFSVPWLFAAGNAFGVAATVTLAAIATLLVARFGAPKAHVGKDGIRVTGKWTQPFVPYRDIRGVRVWERGVLVLLDDERVLQLETNEKDLLSSEIEKALVAHGARIAAVGPASLARQGRPLREWQADVARLAVAAPGFRDQAWSREDLERVLDDAGSLVEHRVGAALALRTDPSARVRIRVAAEGTANAELRAALEACATDDEALDEAPLERATMVVP